MVSVSDDVPLHLGAVRWAYHTKLDPPSRPTGAASVNKDAPIVAVIDDDRAIRTALSSLLRSAGYRVCLFENAEAFLDAREIATAHCIVTDIQMPGLSGLDFIEQLNENGSSIPVLVITAFPEAPIRMRAERLGVAAFLSKPFDAATILRSIESALSGLTGAV